MFGKNWPKFTPKQVYGTPLDYLLFGFSSGRLDMRVLMLKASGVELPDPVAQDDFIGRTSFHGHFWVFRCTPGTTLGHVVPDHTAKAVFYYTILYYTILYYAILYYTIQARRMFYEAGSPL